MNIIVDSSKLKYNIKLYDRVSFLYGKSGTGKTKLCNIINAKGDYDVTITTETNYYTVIAMIYSGEVDIIDRVLDVGKHIIIVDEDATDYHSLCLDSVCRLCREKDNYVVFINRDFNIGSIDRRNILYAYHTIENSKDYIIVEPLVYKLYRDSTTLLSPNEFLYKFS